MTLNSFVILVLVATIAVVIYVELAGLPGIKARERTHPQAEAINLLGWIGLLMGGPLWLLALVWAYTTQSVLAAAEPALASAPADDPAE